MYWLNVFKLLIRANIKTQMEYRLNFAFYILSAVLANLLNMFFLGVVLKRFSNLQHWTLNEIFFLFSLRLVAHGLRVLFFYNVQRISYYVRQGEFDRFLLRPLNPLFQILTWQYHPAAIGDLSTGIICLVLAGNLLNIHWTFFSLIYLLSVVIGGCLIEAALFLATHTLAFWLIDTTRFTFIVMLFNDYLTLYPLVIFNLPTQILLTFIIPVAFINYYPATFFINRISEVPFTPFFAYATPLVGIGMFILAYLFWQFGQKHYMGTGS